MKITIWGCRGSVPTPGADTLRYGGNTTCIEVRAADGVPLIIDAGTGIRLLGRKILEEPDGPASITLLLTHAHLDHLMGFPFFGPMYYSRFVIRVMGGAAARQSLRHYLTRQMEPPYFPVDFSAAKAEFRFDTGLPGAQASDPLQVEPIHLNHPNGGYGYRFTEDGKRFVFLTDNELGGVHEGGRSFQEYVDFCRDADLLIHDAQYTDEEYKRKVGWGHSTFRAAGHLAVRAGVHRLGLFHHDPDRTDHELDRLVGECQCDVTAEKAPTEVFAVAEGQELIL